MNILHYLSVPFYDILPCFAAAKLGSAACCRTKLNPQWTILDAGTRIKAFPWSQLLASCRAAKWHKTVQFCLQSYETVFLMWKKEAGGMPVQGQLQMSDYRGSREDDSLSSTTPKSHRLMVILFSPPLTFILSPLFHPLPLFAFLPREICGDQYHFHILSVKCEDITWRWLAHLSLCGGGCGGGVGVIGRVTVSLDLFQVEFCFAALSNSHHILFNPQLAIVKSGKSPRNRIIYVIEHKFLMLMACHITYVICIDLSGIRIFLLETQYNS